MKRIFLVKIGLGSLVKFFVLSGIVTGFLLGIVSFIMFLSDEHVMVTPLLLNTDYLKGVEGGIYNFVTLPIIGAFVGGLVGGFSRTKQRGLT